MVLLNVLFVIIIMDIFIIPPFKIVQLIVLQINFGTVIHFNVLIVLCNMDSIVLLVTAKVKFLIILIKIILKKIIKHV